MQEKRMRDDLISRQAAIDVLSVGKEILSRVLDDMDVVGADREKYSWGLELIESYINDIEELPPAQPEQSDVSEFWQKRADYYSDLCMRLIAEMGKGVKIESVKINENGIEFIKEQPSAQPEHIHCKDCRWFKPDRHQCGRQICAVFYEDDYCSFAERSTDDKRRGNQLDN